MNLADGDGEFLRKHRTHNQGCAQNWSGQLYKLINFYVKKFLIPCGNDKERQATGKFKGMMQQTKTGAGAR